MRWSLNLFTVLFIARPLWAADELKSWKHESEAAVVTTSGNSDTEAYSAKQATSYEFYNNVIGSKGSYLQNKTSGVETAKSWDISLRYERMISDLWSAFAQIQSESNPYGGIIQRDNYDLGGKYFFNKGENRDAFSEFGVRSSKTNLTNTITEGRLYVEYNQPVSDGVDFKAWIEYVRPFNSPDDYRFNWSPSLTVALNRHFSMRLSYVVKTDNSVQPPLQKTDRQSLVSLVAKF